MNDNNVIAAVDACLALRDITVTFLYISPQPLLLSWTWLYHQKANRMTFPTIYCPYENILNFKSTSLIHFSAVRPFKPMGLGAHRYTDTQTHTQKWKQYVRQFHSVHLADIINVTYYVIWRCMCSDGKWQGSDRRARCSPPGTSLLHCLVNWNRRRHRHRRRLLLRLLRCLPLHLQWRLLPPLLARHDPSGVLCKGWCLGRVRRMLLRLNTRKGACNKSVESSDITFRLCTELLRLNCFIS